MVTSAAEHITERVRARIRTERPLSGQLPERAERLVDEEVRLYSEQALGGRAALISDEPALIRETLADLTGYGALQPLLDDPGIEEIWINSPTRVFIARGGIAELTTLSLTETEVRDLVERMLQHTGRRVDLSSPFVDASLPDGSRLHVVLPGITRRHMSVNIRKFTRRIRSLNHLAEAGSLTREAAEFLRMSVLAGQNILVAGATQAGKTTLLGALLSAARPGDRIVTVEETYELDIDARDIVAMQCRQAGLDGEGEITLRRLIKEALRMRPDRIVVGEVREAESLDLLIALNSGLPGACSIHANSAEDALDKLCTLPLLAGRNIDAEFVVPTVLNCIDLVVFCELGRDGRRRVREIAVPRERVGHHLRTESLFAMRGEELLPTGALPRLVKFASAGFDPTPLLAVG